MLALGVFPFEKFYRGVGVDRACKVPLLAVDACCKHLAGEAGRYGLGNLERGHTGFKFLDAVIGKSDFNHAVWVNNDAVACIGCALGLKSPQRYEIFAICNAFN